MQIRCAHLDDHEAIRELCAAAWRPDESDYLARIYPEWIDGDDKRTIVAVTGSRIVGIAQAVMLSETEAWYQGLRIHPDCQGTGAATTLLESLDSWAIQQGAEVTRNWVFSWNQAGMGLVRSLGYRAVTSIRWARPIPDPGAIPDATVRQPEVAWDIWTTSETREALGGLTLDRDQSWALSRCTREDVLTAGESHGTAAIMDDDHRAMTYRVRQYVNDGAKGAEYAVATWNSVSAADQLFRFIARDAAALGVDEIRVPIPETPQAVSDVAACRVPLDAEPNLIFEQTL